MTTARCAASATLTTDALQPSLVLHRRPLRESSLLVDVLTAEHGRIGLVARGVRGTRQGKIGLLQPLQPLLIGWRGRGELYTLTGVEPAGPPIHLTGDTLYSALYVNELLMRLLERNLPLPGVYPLYLETLLGLQHLEGADWVLRRFEFRLLGLLGYAIDWLHTIDGRRIEAEADYRYLPEQGLIPAPAGASGIVVSGVTLQALFNEARPSAEIRRQARRLLQPMLMAQLGPRPLASRELLRRHRNTNVHKRSDG